MKPFALITGASSGLGKEFATLFARDGYGVVLVARRRERLDALAEELARLHGVSTHVIAADLSEPEAAQKVYAYVQAANLDVQFLVNNAGFGSTGSFWQLDLSRESEMVQLNIGALLALCRLVLPQMVAAKRGRILNIASTAAFQPGPFMATYFASKAFVMSFTQALAFELRGTGVTTTCSCPGATNTEFAATSGNAETKLFKSPGVASAAHVAGEAYRAMHAGKGVVVHGGRNKIGRFLARFTPSFLLMHVVAKLTRP